VYEYVASTAKSEHIAHSHLCAAVLVLRLVSTGPDNSTSSIEQLLLHRAFEKLAMGHQVLESNSLCGTTQTESDRDDNVTKRGAALARLFEAVKGDAKNEGVVLPRVCDCTNTLWSSCYSARCKNSATGVR
jgi:hypothetical protein